MDALEFGFLEACSEVTQRQQEMLPQLAAVLNVPENRVFYTWALRRCGQRGKLADADWSYFFHGLDCDFRNDRDGRFLRMDFGPGGRVGFLDGYGVLQFIATSAPPWRAFPELRAYFSEVRADEASRANAKMLLMWNRLEASGAFEQADRELMALQAKFSARGPDGLIHVRYPADMTDEERIDCSVAHRLRLSPIGLQLLKSHWAPQAVPDENVSAAARNPAMFTQT